MIDLKVVVDKMARNGKKTAIWAGGWGRLLIDDDPLITSLICSSYFGIYFSRSNKGDISSFIDHSFTLLSHHFSPKITLAEHNSTGCPILKCANVNGSERSIILLNYGV